MTPKPTDSRALAALIARRGRTARSITAIAGPPGAGKSTVAEALADELNAAEPGSAAVLPMDGYHYDDIVLEARGDRARKGAPHTFDVGGFAAMLARLRANTEEEIAVPVFDRSIEIARNAARIIPQTVRHLIVEGNYLLLDRPPWTSLAASFDTTVFLDVPTEELRARLTERWKDLAPDAFAEKMEGNDLPNVHLVQEASRPAEFVIRDA
ncbi:nucleoside/nucleotide kinase family protein [Psychromarinibacter sp. C21-152]|uniref:Nucleoside/nucleotide kinase family protein n=1 Tax=Psychromarinibacter sediminicola TaxID=3033385 RepID=A0AAE3TCD2_9RHOB|nr:nucleoside/nucleotide kinase family protein [Psychromarinibacter sediminicola]MDF0603849.1 nucleoside/nucleotide kinase family protein [Psychromarinibacter sediminicola]